MRTAIVRLSLFFFVAMLICWLNAALRAAQENLRRSELNFRSLVTNAPYGICRCDSTGKILDANPAFLELLGHTSPDELIGQHIFGLYAEHDKWFDLADYLRSSEPFKGLTAEWKRKNGTTTVVRVSGRSVLNGGEGVVFELFAEDVTERRALEQQLRQSQKMEAVGRLAGGIAHDFNNLLMVILGYSEFLLERLGAEPHLRGPAQEIASAAERASSLTRQLLAFSRKQMLAPRIVNLNDVATENIKMLTRMIGEDIDLVMVPAPNLWPIRADAGQIDQVIMNLAVNARDAMPSGGKLTIETSNVTLDEEYARFHAPLRPGDYVMLAHQRHRRWHGHRHSVAHLRAFLHHQGTRREPDSACRRSTASSSRAADTSGSTANWAGARPSRSTCRASPPSANRPPRKSPRLSNTAKSSPAPKPFCWSRTKPTCATWRASTSRSKATK